MNYFYEILFGILGTVGSGLATWLVVIITTWLNKKIKDKKLAKLATDVMTLIMTVVQQTYQVYVEALKKEGKFNAKAQTTAKDAAIAEIKKQLTEEQKEYIQSIAADAEDWLNLQIESMIYQLKK